MKNMMLKCIAFAALSVGFAFGASAATPIEYLEPVYKGTDGNPTNGIDRWATKSVSTYTAVASSASAVTWGMSGATSWYVVTGGDFQIDKGVTCAGHVNLILCEGAKLVVTNVASGKAAIATDANGSFTIYGQPNGAGELSATAAKGSLSNPNGAGIGGNNGAVGSNITINGGTVTTTGGYAGAGIGGGSAAGSNITINGGTVTTTGGYAGAGIGGGRTAAGSNITINGGTVMAVSGGSAAGIGGGGRSNDLSSSGGAGLDITINGGTVTAKGIAAIGGNARAPGSNIAINGGTVGLIWIELSTSAIGHGQIAIFSGSSGNRISPEAKVFFSAASSYSVPSDFDGNVLAPGQDRCNRILVSGISDATALSTLSVTNPTTGATCELLLNGPEIIFNKMYFSLTNDAGSIKYVMRQPELTITQQPNVTGGYKIDASTDGNNGITNYAWMTAKTIDTETLMKTVRKGTGGFTPDGVVTDQNGKVTLQWDSTNLTSIGEFRFTSTAPLYKNLGANHPGYGRMKSLGNNRWAVVPVLNNKTKRFDLDVSGYTSNYELTDLTWVGGETTIAEGETMTTIPHTLAEKGTNYICFVTHGLEGLYYTEASEIFTYQGISVEIPSVTHATVTNITVNGTSVAVTTPVAVPVNGTIVVTYKADTGYHLTGGTSATLTNVTEDNKTIDVSAVTVAKGELCSTWAQVKANLEAGYDVKLTQDVAQGSVAGAAISGKTVTLDLNGFKITGSSQTGETYRPFTLSSNTALTLVDGAASQTGVLDDNNVMRTGSGGCVYVNSGCTFTMNGGVITNYSAAVNGGAVYVAGSGSFTMNSGRITKCTAVSLGGAVYNAAGGTFTMTGGEIVGCSSTNLGGGLFSNGAVTMRNAVMKLNYSASGGAIRFDGATATIDNMTFTDNAVQNYGGAINFGNTGGSYVLRNCTLKNNTAGQTGGALIVGKDIKVDVYDSTITDNVTTNGGAVNVNAFTGNQLNLYGAVIVGNKKGEAISDFDLSRSGATTVYGGVYGTNPSSVKNLAIADGYSSTLVGSKYVVGKSVVFDSNNKLTAGTYTFCPTNAEYVAAGVAVADGTPIKANTTATPKTWILGIEVAIPSVTHATVTNIVVNGELVGAAASACVPSNGTVTVLYTPAEGYVFTGATSATLTKVTEDNKTIDVSNVTTALKDPEVTNVTARQRYPWNGKVDISYTVSNLTAVAEVEGKTPAIRVMAINRSTTPWTTNVASSTYLFVGPLATEALTDAVVTSNGTHQIVWDMNAQGLTFKSADIVFAVSGVINGAFLEGVQLWEGGPYFAECNVGAAKATDSGYFYWWGDTIGYKRNAGNTGWEASDGSTTSFSFSTDTTLTWGMDFDALKAAGYVDSATNLVAAHDAATVRLGAPWRMPTDAEIVSLVANCTTTWMTSNSVNGRLFQGKGDYATKSIFLPASGEGNGVNRDNYPNNGDFWSSTAKEDVDGWGMQFYNQDAYRRGYWRFYGHNIRPVHSGTGLVPLCTGESEQSRVDLSTGTRMTMGNVSLTYSSAWFGGSSVALAENGTVLEGAEALTGSGTYVWTPSDLGTFTLTHTVVTSGVPVVLSATFNVPLKPIEYTAPVYKTEGVPASGIDHWVTNTVSDFTVVTNLTDEQIWNYEFWGAPGATNWYVVTNGTTLINRHVYCRGNVNLVLCNDATLTIITNTPWASASIIVEGALTIYSEKAVEGKATGKLIIPNGANASYAGIDTAYNAPAVSVTINGGEITATGGTGAAGIGGRVKWSGVNITINGGVINATGGNSAAGIGGGGGGAGSNIVINAGIVVAKGGDYGAGIGCGAPISDGTAEYRGIGTDIKILGGNVTAIGGIGAAAIGGGPELQGTHITIGDAKVAVGGVGRLYEGNLQIQDLIGNGMICTNDAEDITISDSAQVLFNVSGLHKITLDHVGYSNIVEVIEPMAPMPDDFSGLVILTPETQTYDRVLASGVANWTASKTFALTNGVTGATGSIVVNNAAGSTFAGANLILPHADNTLKLMKNPVVFAASVTTNGVTTSFTSITSAWEVAKTGVTNSPAILTLLSDVELTQQLKADITTFLTFDLGGKTLSAADDFNESLIVGQGAGVGMNYLLSHLVISNGTITGSKASAIYGTAAFTLDHVLLTGNSAENGAAIYCEMLGELLLKDCVLSNNVATTSGGAVKMIGGKSTANKSVNKCLLVRTLVTDNHAGVTGGGIQYQPTTCFAAGTRILLADGTEKAVEDISEGDLVATFDHEGGTNSSARVYYATKSKAKSVSFTLEFDTPLSLSIVGCHDLLEQESRKYVTITEGNAKSFIGKRFYGADGNWHTLTGVTFASETVECYSIYSAQHQNVYANGLLTAADDVDYLLNIYELDENLKANAAQLAADFAQHGTISYEEASTYGVSRDWYDDAGMKYLYIAIGKNLVSREYVEQLFASTGRVSAPVSPKMALLAAPMSATPNAADPTLGDVGESIVTLGPGAVVMNNFANSLPSNLYLEDNTEDPTLTRPAYITFASADHSGVCIGVTHSSGTGQFTAQGGLSASDAALFMSDLPQYGVRYSSGYLELAAGVQVGADAWAHLRGDTCTITGSGMVTNTAALKAMGVTNLTVTAGVTGIAANMFGDWGSLRDVSLGADCTNIASQAFAYCDNLTNVSCAATASLTIGDHAFYRCNSLESLSFGVLPTLGEQAYTLQSGIYIKDGMPEIYPIPKISVEGYRLALMGSVDLQSWTEIKTEAEKLDYNFFKLKLEPSGK